jgi:hypothetical protein
MVKGEMPSGTIVAVAPGDAQLARRLRPFTTTIFATMS